MSETDFLSKIKSSIVFLDDSLIIKLKSPINIALVKYWGKLNDEFNIPLNESISFTLSTQDLYTETTVTLTSKIASNTFYLNNIIDTKTISETNIRFRNLMDFVTKHSNAQTLNGTHFDKHRLASQKILARSENNFPTAAGLASSASGLSCLAVCLCALQNVTFVGQEGVKQSIPARLGSGSACRSLFGGVVKWQIGFNPYKEYQSITQNKQANILHNYNHYLFNANSSNGKFDFENLPKNLSQKKDTSMTDYVPETPKLKSNININNFDGNDFLSPVTTNKKDSIEIQQSLFLNSKKNSINNNDFIQDQLQLINEDQENDNNQTLTSICEHFNEHIKRQSDEQYNSTSRQIFSKNHLDLAVLIFICNQEEKDISSTLGQQYSVKNSELLKHRVINIVPRRIEQMEQAILTKNQSELFDLIIKESDQLHAICMDSGLNQINDVSKKVMKQVRSLNQKQSSNVCAQSIDAGANVYVFTTDVKLFLQGLNLDSLQLNDKLKHEYQRCNVYKNNIGEDSDEDDAEIVCDNRTVFTRSEMSKVILTKIGDGIIPEIPSMLNGQAPEQNKEVRICTNNNKKINLKKSN